MELAPWYLTIGALLVVVALVSSLLRPLPLSSTMLCLALGVVLGPGGVGLIKLDPSRDAEVLEHLTEVAVLISLFTAGLKLRMPLGDRQWFIPLRLAVVSMAITVGLIAAAGVFVLGLPIGAAVLLGAILAPTDPVLASEVQVTKSTDRDRLRFALTAEAGLNDGTAFPLVMLGLGLLGAHEIGAGAWRWWAVDLLWAVPAGLAIGGVLGAGVGKLVLYLRLRHKEGVGLDNFLAVGLIALSYGAALYAHAYGFLAVFAAGLSLRMIEMRSSDEAPSDEVRAKASATHVDEMATSRETAPAYMAEAVLNFNDQLERFAEVGMVVLLGAILRWEHWRPEIWWFVPLLLLVIRPLSVAIGLAGGTASPLERGMIAWFGIRGIGSLFYLTYAINHRLPNPFADQLISLTLMTVAASIIVHGATVTPLMAVYRRYRT